VAGKYFSRQEASGLFTHRTKGERMKVGDEIDVTISGHRVAGARVKEIDPKTNQVILEVPPVKVTMLYRTEVTQPVSAGGASSHSMMGIEEQPAPQAPVEPEKVDPPPAVEAPVVDNTPAVESASGTAPVEEPTNDA
jgi:sRNA-binding carbon storage regulator CsrA